MYAGHGAHGQARGCHTAQPELDAGGGAGEDGGEEGSGCGRRSAPSRPIAAQAKQRAVDCVSEQRAGAADVEDVGPQGREAAIGEDQSLNDRHGDHHQIGGPGPEDHGQQHTTQKVAAGPGGHRKVERLGREHGSRGEAEGRGGPLVQMALGAPRRVSGDGARGHEGGGRDGCRYEAVGYVCHERSCQRSPGRLLGGSAAACPRI